MLTQVGAALGAAWTIVLLVGTSLVGVWLVRVEGRRAWSQLRDALADGRWPGDAVAQGALVLLGGVLLVLPGFVTDAVGLLLLLAPTRSALTSVLRARTLAGGQRTRTRRVGGRARGGHRHAGGHPHGQARGRVVPGVEVVEIAREPLDGQGEDVDDRRALRDPRDGD